MLFEEGEQTPPLRPTEMNFSENRPPPPPLELRPKIMYDKFPLLVQHDLAIIYLKLPVQDPMISATSFFHVKFKSWYIGLN